MPGALPPVSVVVLGAASCPCAARVHAVLSALGVPFTTVVLELDQLPTAPPPGRSGTSGAECGYISPTVEIAGRRSRPERLVQPSDAELREALRRYGVAARAV